MKPPCMKNGVDCPRRCIGCQAQCPDYRQFRAKCDAAITRRMAESEATDTRIEGLFRMLKKTKKGKRR